MLSFDELLVKEMPMLMCERDGIIYYDVQTGNFLTKIIGGPFDEYWVILPWFAMEMHRRGMLALAQTGQSRLSAFFLADGIHYSPLFARSSLMDPMCDCLIDIATRDIPETRFHPSSVDGLAIESNESYQVASYKINGIWRNANGNPLEIPLIDPENLYYKKYSYFCYCNIELKLTPEEVSV